MKKFLIKGSLMLLAFLAVLLIPGNAQLVFGYGGPTFAGSTTEPPVCNNAQPAQVILYQPNHRLLPKATGSNQVMLNWQSANLANKYTIAFGLSSGHYIYGLPDVGNTTSFTVQSLTPGATYYFVVRGVNNCMPGPWSMEWAVRVPGGGNAGSFIPTNLNTNSPLVRTPPNIVAPTVIPQQTVVTPSVPQTTGLGAFTPPLPTPTSAPQPGFFQGLWHGFLGLFGR